MTMFSGLMIRPGLPRARTISADSESRSGVPPPSTGPSASIGASLQLGNGSSAPAVPPRAARSRAEVPTASERPQQRGCEGSIASLPLCRRTSLPGFTAHRRPACPQSSGTLPLKVTSRRPSELEHLHAPFLGSIVVIVSRRSGLAPLRGAATDGECAGPGGPRALWLRLTSYDKPRHIETVPQAPRWYTCCKCAVIVRSPRRSHGRISVRRSHSGARQCILRGGTRGRAERQRSFERD